MDKKKALIIVAVLVVIIACYYFFFGVSDEVQSGNENTSSKSGSTAGKTSSGSSSTPSDSSVTSNSAALAATIGKKYYLNASGVTAANGEKLFAEGIDKVALLKSNSGTAKVNKTLTGSSDVSWVVGTIDKVTGSYVRVGLNKWVRKGDYAGHLYVRR